MSERRGILIIGGHGLVGSRIVELLGDAFPFKNQSCRTGFDITDARAMREKIVSSPNPLFLGVAAGHFAEELNDGRS